MDAVATAGSFLQMPVRYERLYDEYEVTGDTALRRAVRPPVATPAEDSIAGAACHERAAREKISCKCRSGGGPCLALRVKNTTVTDALLASAAVPPTFQC